MTSSGRCHQLIILTCCLSRIFAASPWLPNVDTQPTSVIKAWLRHQLQTPVQRLHDSGSTLYDDAEDSYSLEMSDDYDVSRNTHPTYFNMRDLGSLSETKKRGINFPSGKTVFIPWGKRSFSPWKGQRSSYDLNLWAEKRAADLFDLLGVSWRDTEGDNQPSSSHLDPMSWNGAKRAAFNPWGGKRSFRPMAWVRQTLSTTPNRPKLRKKGFNPWGG
jgi:hypothetical protein